MTDPTDPDFDRWAFTDLHHLREQYLDGKSEPTGLVDWLESQIGFVEWIAQRTMQAGPRWQNFDMDGELRDNTNAGTVAQFGHPQDRAHVALNDPAQALAEVDAKRRIIAAVNALDENGDIYLATGTHLDTDAIWAALVLPYADRDGYDQHWAPDPAPIPDDQLERYEAAARGLRGNLLAMVDADMPQPSHLKTAITGIVNLAADTWEMPTLMEMIRSRPDLRPAGNGSCYAASWGMVHSRPSCRCKR